MGQTPRTDKPETEEVNIDEIPPMGAPIISLMLLYIAYMGLGDLALNLAVGGAGIAISAAFGFKFSRLYQKRGLNKAINWATTAPIDRKEDYSLGLQTSPGIEKTEKGITLEHLRNISYTQFEELVAKVWENKGYETRIVPDGGGDGGIDIIAKKNEMNNTEKVLIQAKRNSEDNKVSSPKVREYSGLKNQEDNVDKVYVVTTSDFTKNALDVAKQNNVKTLNGKEFLRQYQKYVEENQ